MASLNLMYVHTDSENDSVELTEKATTQELHIEKLEEDLTKAKRKLLGIQIKQREKRKAAKAKRSLTKSNSNSKMPLTDVGVSAASSRARSSAAASASSQSSRAPSPMSDTESTKEATKKADIEEMQQRQAKVKAEKDEEASVRRSEGGRRALDEENKRSEVLLRGREDGARRFQQREAEREQRGASSTDGGAAKGFKGGLSNALNSEPQSDARARARDSGFTDTGAGKGFGMRSSRFGAQMGFAPREFRDSRAPMLTREMDDVEKMNVADSFHLGLREWSANVEARRPDLGAIHKEGIAVTDLDIAVYLANPSKGNSRTTYEDVEGSKYFQQLRAKYNVIDKLRVGVEFLSLVPTSPARLNLVVDQFGGRDKGTTSGIMIRRVGCPAFNCGYQNELNWMPRLLTANGIFGVGTYAVVATKVQYRYPGPDTGVKEAVFIGELWITLASRDLAEVYIEALHEKVRINGNVKPVTAEWAGYMLSGKDLPRAGEMPLDRARVDKGIWEFPNQFDGEGKFLSNGPGMPYELSDFTIDER